jgi:tetratricopeptide (TPR) repeat protein
MTDADNIITKYSNNPSLESATKILAETYYIRGLIFLSQRDHSKAAEDFSEAIKNNLPNIVRAYEKRGSVNLKIKKYDQAIEDYKKAYQDEDTLKKRLAEIYTQRGIEYHKKGDYPNAAKDYEKALEYDPNDAQTQELLGFAKGQM